MKLNENLRLCLLALVSRHPDSRISINEEVVGAQSTQAEEYTPFGVIELLQGHTPPVLDAPACLVLDAQERVIYLVEQSQQTPAFWIHYRERMQEEEIASLHRENAALKAENRELKTQLAQMLPV
jgi:hypothetical protein